MTIETDIRDCETARRVFEDCMRGAPPRPRRSSASLTIPGLTPVAPGSSNTATVESRGTACIKGIDGMPLAGEPYVLIVGGHTYPGVTDGRGWITNVATLGGATGATPTATSAILHVGEGAYHIEFKAASSNIHKTAQSMLNALGFSAGTLDGVVGPRTKMALAYYQFNRAIPVTGKADTATLTQLHADFETPATLPTLPGPPPVTGATPTHVSTTTSAAAAVVRRPRNPRSLTDWTAGTLPGNPRTIKYTYGALAPGWETLDSIVDLTRGTWRDAEQVLLRNSMTWTDVALLNFGTDDPAEINWYLKYFNGATALDSTGSYYVFSAADTNPFIYLPLRDLQSGLDVVLPPTVPVAVLQPPPAPTAITQIFERRWDEIDVAPRDGVLDAGNNHELRTLITSMAFSGDDAAALAALLTQVQGADNQREANSWQGRRRISHADLTHVDRISSETEIARNGDATLLAQRIEMFANSRFLLGYFERTHRGANFPETMTALIHACEQRYHRDFSTPLVPATATTPERPAVVADIHDRHLPDYILASKPSLLKTILINDRGAYRGILAWFEMNKAKIAKIGNDLFPPGTVNPFALEQQGVGECWYDATVVALMGRCDGVVRGLIAQDVASPAESDLTTRVTYTVTFRDTVDRHTGRPKSATVKRRICPTDTEIAFYGYSNGNGLWPPVLELAVGLCGIGGDYNGRSDPVNNMDGGYPDNVMPLLTGNQSDTYALTAHNLQWFRDKLVASMAANKVVVSGIDASREVAGTGRTAAHWPITHEYSIISYDDATQIIEIRNPWGTARPTATDPSPSYPAGATIGSFEKISLPDEFMTNFSDITFER